MGRGFLLAVGVCSRRDPKKGTLFGMKNLAAADWSGPDWFF
jgi:hypothetical protein